MADYYETHAADYADIEPEPVWREQLVRFAARLKPGCRVLDLGCGAGHDSHWLKSNGFDVVSVDASSAMAREAKLRYDLDVRVEKIESLVEHSEFDAVWASASIHHVHRNTIPAAIASVANSLKPGGLFYSSYKLLGSDLVDRLGRHYTAIDGSELGSIMSAAGLKIIETSTLGGVGADGIARDFICLTTSKSAY